MKGNNTFMKKSLLILPALMIAGLSGCAGGGDNICDQAINSLPILLDNSTGKEINLSDEKIEAKDLDSFLALNTLTWQNKEFDLKWTPAPAEKWKVKDYSADEERTKYTPIYGAEAFDCSLTLDISTKDGKAKSKAVWNFTADAHKAVDLTNYTYVSIPDLIKGNVQDGDYGSGKIWTVGYIHSHHESPDHVYSGLYIGDGDFSIMLYAGQISKLWSAYEFEIGDKVVMCGAPSPYKGLYEVKPDNMDFAETYEHASDVTLPTVLNGNDLIWSNTDKTDDGALVHQSSKVKYTGAEFVSGDGKSNTSLVFKFGTVEISVYMNYHLGTALIDEVVELFKDAKAGDKYDIEGVISVSNDIVQIIPTLGAAGLKKVAA